MPNTYSTFDGNKAPQIINTVINGRDTQKTAETLFDLIIRPPYNFC